jgi:hypothetical protein
MARRANGEPVKAASGRHPDDRYAADHRAGRARPEQVLESVERRRRPFRHCSDGAVVLIRYPTGEAKATRLANDVVSESDSLNATADDGLEPDQVVHSGSPVAARPGQQQDVDGEFRADVCFQQFAGPV